MTTDNMEKYNAIKEAIENARAESDGLTLNAIARAINEVLDDSEVRILVEELFVTRVWNKPLFSVRFFSLLPWAW